MNRGGGWFFFFLPLVNSPLTPNQVSFPGAWDGRRGCAICIPALMTGQTKNRQAPLGKEPRSTVRRVCGRKRVGWMAEHSDTVYVPIFGLSSLVRNLLGKVGAFPDTRQGGW
ncbi:uncharacterized protein LY79DRAFT_292422 [Colletotrichum navitas]|uniref:Secreted protein n=1 Tax=Colletotrichum navitas TaxID=681940 RepID=A0AAD8PVN7_9PEZI|nr:uncharacterized protein LY79DRAFT_292422 [Colletotrichum navitas]KAK1584744.1 hypothetical protein LY79DRAFT_292422 [Colletotrichum navitas]